MYYLTNIHIFSILRIEFNQQHLEYHTAIDAVLLSGYQPESEFKYELIRNGLTQIKPLKVVNSLTVRDLENSGKCDVLEESFKEDYFSVLPVSFCTDYFFIIINSTWYNYGFIKFLSN